MKKLILILVALLAPITAMLVSCTNTSPTSSSTPTPTPIITPTFTPTPSVKNLATFSSGVSLYGICVDSSDNVYAADYDYNGTFSQLIKVTSAGVTSDLVNISSIMDVVYDGTNWYTSAQANPSFIYYSGGVTTAPIASGAAAIYGLALNSGATTLAVAYSGSVSFYSLPGFSSLTSATITLLPSTPPGPECLSYDNSGDLYVALASYVIKYAPGSTNAYTTVGGSGTTGYVDGSATSGAEFNYITAIAVDKNKNVYLTDDGSAGTDISVREIYGNTVQTLAGPTAAGVTPIVPLTLTNQSELDGIAVDNTGDLFVADRGSTHTIYEYIP